ncbi:uncharacterized protein [Salmo salar]|uniref:Uncharacterized protein LOC106569017 n=1 Tax=Salmo salar TaxID=8030 RepID=A0A1S3LWW9_SALSA|nr:uncharacterized protein LOC106569017 [Salmo salar]XP_013995423.1 uncharacterized protein LOC106569017 [Salmo salar]|eukprot:XP_013995422.1 PREDICTED: uncharacterized protein LOC106569017 [Salmo salar]
MEDRSLPRIVVITLSVLIYISALAINAMAGAGKGPFHWSTGNISRKYETDITPAGWTFSIWGLIYTWLTLMIMYIISLIYRGSWTLSVLLYGFYLSWIVNMALNMTWLLLWDQEQVTAALIVMATIAVTNYSMVFFSCYGLSIYGAWLSQNHPRDLWCIQLLVQNGIALYTTWTTIATLINFTLVLDLSGVAKSTAATVSLCILLVEVIGWFGIENFLLYQHVRYILTIYPVVIIALVGNVTKHYDPAAPSANAIFMVVLLVISCVLLVVRVSLVIRRNRNQTLHPEALTSPSSLSKKHRKIFM